MQDLRDYLSALASRNVHYEPMVSDASDILKYFAEQNNIKTEWTNFAESDLELAVGEFEDALSKKEAVILMGATENKKILSRNRREISDVDNSTTNSAFGENCAALFEEIYAINLANGLPAPEPIYLNLTKSEFTCNNSTSKFPL